jgi:condensin complex subunit 2
MNDDRVEKAQRLKSRQALREVELNSVHATASPGRKQQQFSREDSAPPRTPRSSTAAEARRRTAYGSSDSPSQSGHNVVSHSAITPMKRGPILANFEEWMKMATDNKINATNSWNFALIDYFHDMSLLKEGDGVNFQKASCTLDGCVKIYTNRVDSVATETGRLLSGLADSGEGKGGGKGGRKGQEKGGEGDEDGDGDEEDDDDEGGGKKKAKKKTVRSHEATLAPSFASLQLKKLELEFTVDPLFKKASADFDEGGAKGLLLNHLCIDGEGRIVFDSSDDAGDVMVGGQANQPPQQQEGEDTDQDRGRDTTRRRSAGAEKVGEGGDEEIDLNSLASKFFPDLSVLDTQDICPSMKSFKLDDPSGDLSIPFLKAPDDWKSPNKKDTNPSPKLDLNLADQTGIFLDGTNAAGFDDDDNDGILGGFDMPDTVGFGEGGEAWAKDAALEPMLRVTKADGGGVGDGEDDEGGTNAYTVQLQNRFREETEHASILQYFDKAFNSKKGRAAWSKGQGMQGAEYWRIAKIQMAQQAQSEKTAAPRAARKEKEPFEIDFFGPMADELQELLALPPASNAAISLPRAQWKTKGRNLLERDSGEGEWVDVKKDMVRLWLKPRALIRRRRGGGTMTTTMVGVGGDIVEEEGRKGDYDANFFADDDEGLHFDDPLPIDEDDDGLGVEENDGDSEGQVFMDAREMLSPPPTTDGGDDPHLQPDSQGLHLPGPSQSEMLPGSFGSQLVTQAGGLLGRKLRPEYVSYARVAKKVDVRRLKEEMWKGMVVGLDRLDSNSRPPPAPTKPNDDGDIDMMDVDAPSHEQEDQIEKAVTKGATELKFTDMIGELKSVYPEQQMKDISTSYCFICLLHLANEKGLVLEGGREEGEGGTGMQEIWVRRDVSVGEGYVGE